MYLSLLSTSSNVNELLSTYFQVQGIQHHVCDRVSSLDFHTCTHLILTEPSFIEKESLTCASVFKEYLAKNHEHIHLIPAGTFAESHPNYLDLFNLPIDFTEFLAKLLPVKDPWKIYQEQETTLRQYLSYFFNDHGSQSFMDRAPYFRMTLMSMDKAYNELPHSEEKLCEDLIPMAKRQWAELKRRWDMYICFFQYTPFWIEVEKLDHELGDFSKFFDTHTIFLERELFEEGNFVKRFEQFLVHLKGIKGYC